MTRLLVAVLVLASVACSKSDEDKSVVDGSGATMLGVDTELTINISINDGDEVIAWNEEKLGVYTQSALSYVFSFSTNSDETSKSATFSGVANISPLDMVYFVYPKPEADHQIQSFPYEIVEQDQTLSQIYAAKMVYSGSSNELNVALYPMMVKVSMDMQIPASVDMNDIEKIQLVSGDLYTKRYLNTNTDPLSWTGGDKFSMLTLTDFPRETTPSSKSDSDSVLSDYSFNFFMFPTAELETLTLSMMDDNNMKVYYLEMDNEEGGALYGFDFSSAGVAPLEPEYVPIDPNVDSSVDSSGQGGSLVNPEEAPVEPDDNIGGSTESSGGLVNPNEDADPDPEPEPDPDVPTDPDPDVPTDPDPSTDDTDTDIEGSGDGNSPVEQDKESTDSDIEGSGDGGSPLEPNDDSTDSDIEGSADGGSPLEPNDDSADSDIEGSGDGGSPVEPTDNSADSNIEGSGDGGSPVEPTDNSADSNIEGSIDGSSPVQ